MQKERGRNNAASLFGVERIPSTQQMCNLLDPVDPAHVAPLSLAIVAAHYQYLPFESWEHLFDFMLEGLSPAPPKSKAPSKAPPQAG
jgi:hypothetical protein